MTSIQGRPTAAELVEAVRELLRDKLLPESTGGVAFEVRVAAAALAMVERELAGAAGDGPWAAELLGFADDAALAAAIRAGQLDDDGRVTAALLRDVHGRLRVSAPRYVTEYERDDFSLL